MKRKGESRHLRKKDREKKKEKFESATEDSRRKRWRHHKDQAELDCSSFIVIIYL